MIAGRPRPGLAAALQTRGGRLRKTILLALLTAAGAAAGGIPENSELLRYSVNWPSGLSIGEGRLESQRKGDAWAFQFVLEAAVPGFSVAGRYRSHARADFCSLEFERNAVYGPRRAFERITFDYRRGIAQRVTLGGARRRMPLAGCQRDPLSFLFFLRGELRQGRLPPPQTVLEGADYYVRLQYDGVHEVPVSEKPVRADRFLVFAKGSSSARDLNFEIFFARDAGRAPLLVRVPLAPGVFSMELAH